MRPSESYLGPTLELRRGERVRIEFVNRTGESSIVHWHGMIVPARADGHPRFAIPSGQTFIYEFTVRNPAGTYLYHPHPDGRTGRQVYLGLAGLLIVRDDEERAVGLPDPSYQLSLVIQDRRIDEDNALRFSPTMMDAMSGVLGDTVLTNGVADAAFSVAPRTYRLRVANVSNARIYKLAWSDGGPLRAIASDSGLFDREQGMQTRPYVVLAPFQRVELLEDFAGRANAGRLSLISESFADPGGMMGMMGGGMMGGGMMGRRQGERLQIARFTIAGRSSMSSEPLTLPRAERSTPRGGRELQTRLEFRRMLGLLNGRTFAMDAVAPDEVLPLDQESRWAFVNETGGMAMPHPMHIHGVRFRILGRRGDAPTDLRDGLIDAGYHDTVLVFPGERVWVGVAPTEPGMFMYHCHNLEHEDGGMMRNCWFGARHAG
ncbi:MAG: multicopper oxidase domain-containing protein [Proteobacteria bacterium]|nr:multicopper oxidase domain-containing protein [Pseudomonadota bacterium]